MTNYGADRVILSHQYVNLNEFSYLDSVFLYKMMKKNKSVKPDVVNMDVLAEMPDQDLFARLNSLHEGLNNASPLYKERFEVEIAYCQREIGIRYARIDAHNKFLAQLI